MEAEIPKFKKSVTWPWPRLLRVYSSFIVVLCSTRHGRSNKEKTKCLAFSFQKLWRTSQNLKSRSLTLDMPTKGAWQGSRDSPLLARICLAPHLYSLVSLFSFTSYFAFNIWLGIAYLGGIFCFFGVKIWEDIFGFRSQPNQFFLFRPPKVHAKFREDWLKNVIVGVPTETGWTKKPEYFRDL